MSNKILMLAHFPPPVHGAGIVSEQIHRILASNDCQVEKVNLSFKGNITDLGRFNIFKVFHQFKLVAHLLNAILFFKPDIFYFTPSVSSKLIYREAFFILIVKIFAFISFRNINCFIHIHMRPATKKTLLRRIILKTLFRNNSIILLTKKLVEDFEPQVFHKSQVHYLENFIDPLLNQNEFKLKLIDQEIRRKKANFNVLYFGHMIESKGYKRGLDLSLLLSKDCQDKNVTFHFAGSASDNEIKYITSFIEDNSLSHKVYFAGPLYDADKRMMFYNCDLLILPSYSEAYPLTLLEALSTGMRVLATDVGGISDIVNTKNGVVIKQECKSEQNYLTEFCSQIQNQMDLIDIESSKAIRLDYIKRWNSDIFENSLLKILKVKK